MNAAPFVVETHSPEQTERLGKALAVLLPTGSVAALYGDLATGKTCLVRGMAAHYARNAHVHSPTFTLVNQYGSEPKFYHLDLYRIETPEELLDLGCEELFEPDGVCVLEWAERAAGLLPEKRVDVFLEHIDQDARRITITDCGVLPEGWKEALLSADTKIT